MAKKFYCEDEVRAALKRYVERHDQATAARRANEHPQVVSRFLLGGKPSAKLLAWLGFRQVKGLYEKGVK